MGRRDPARSDESILRRRQAQQIARAPVDAEATPTQAQTAERVGARYWGPGCLANALRFAVANGLIRRVGRGTYAPLEMAPGEKKEAEYGLIFRQVRRPGRAAGPWSMWLVRRR
jgi:hypothetical protein